MGRTDEVQFMQECIAEWRRLGARVTLEPGWESRGNGSQANYEGGIVHHTAINSSAANPNPTRSVLVNGRSDLPGPLCNVAGPWCADDDPWLHVIAAYPANHAGASGGKSMGPLPVTGSFNTRVVGLEIDYSGTAPMTAGQRRAALIFTRGLINVLKVSTEYVRAHAETSVTGKWDPGYAPGKTIDMAAFRREAAAVIPSTPAEIGFLMALSDGEQTELRDKLRDVHSTLLSKFDTAKNTGSQVADNTGHTLGIRADLRNLAQMLSQLSPAAAPVVNVDAAAVASALAGNAAFIAAVGEVTAAAMDRRARDGNPATGPVS